MSDSQVGAYVQPQESQLFSTVPGAGWNTPQNRRVGAAVLGGFAVLGMIASISFGITPSPHWWPDPYHIAAHMLIFSAITALCAPVTGPWKAFGLSMAFGAGVEFLQMWGFGLWMDLFPETRFDLLVDGIGAILGLLPFKEGRNALRTLLQPLVVGAVAFIGVIDATEPSMWSLGLMMGLMGVAGFALRQLGMSVAIALMAVATVAPYSPRGAAMALVAAAVSTLLVRLDRRPESVPSSDLTTPAWMVGTAVFAWSCAGI